MLFRLHYYLVNIHLRNTNYVPDSILKAETVNSNKEIFAFKDPLDSSRKKCKKTDKYSRVLDKPQSIALPGAGLVWRLLTDIWGRVSVEIAS